jgi:hypothetical protein
MAVVRTLLFGLSVFAIASVATAAAPPPPPGGCDRVRKSGNVIRDTSSPEVVCGTRRADRIYVSGRDTVFAGRGNDTIYARNRRPDLIAGGVGRDIAFVDPCDTLTGVEQAAPGRRRCLSPR